MMFSFEQKAAYEMRISDWSSDVCSSDLIGPARAVEIVLARAMDGEVAVRGDIAQFIRHLLRHRQVRKFGIDVADVLALVAGIVPQHAQLVRKIGRASRRERV